MGVSKRRAQIRASQRECLACKQLRWLREEGILPSEDALKELLAKTPHSCITSEEQLRVPIVNTVLETVILPKTVSEGITKLWDFLKKHYPSRHDFLVELIREGLASAMQARDEAEARRQMREAQKANESRLVLTPQEAAEEYRGKRTGAR